MFLCQTGYFLKHSVVIIRYTGLSAAILAAILDFLNCPRVRRPHPPGNNNMDPTDIESEEKKTLSHGSRVTPLGSQTKPPFLLKAHNYVSKNMK
jgi:hypothetical protein